MVSCLDYSSSLEMEAVCSSETSVDFQLTTERYISEDTTIHNHRYDNLKSLSHLTFNARNAHVSTLKGIFIMAKVLIRIHVFGHLIAASRKAHTFLNNYF
jgi:hypothetical protein